MRSLLLDAGRGRGVSTVEKKRMKLRYASLLATLEAALILAVPASAAPATFKPTDPRDHVTGNNSSPDVASADFDGDTNADLAAVSLDTQGNRKVFLLPGNGDGAFGPAVDYAVGGDGSFGLGSVDFDSDATPDFATGSSSGGEGSDASMLLDTDCRRWGATIPPTGSKKTRP
jgi:hypothetical protein